MPTLSPIDTAQAMYATSSQSVRSTFAGNHTKAIACYRELLDFVARMAPPGDAGSKRLLDVGCGCGWTTWCYANAGYDAVGVDLNPDAFEPACGERLRLERGTALSLQFPDASFDVITIHQCLEHVPDPEQALDEMVRVCRPGGTICIVGPNLISPTLSLAVLCNRTLWPVIRWRRTPHMPRHPYGNTVFELLAASIVNSGRLLAKLCSPRPSFAMRVPDTVPPFHSDNDACYLCNPVDLVRYFRRRGMRIVVQGKPGRPPLSYLFAGGTWVAAKKP